MPEGMPIIISAEVCEKIGAVPDTIVAHPMHEGVALEPCMEFNAKQKSLIALRFNMLMNKAGV